MRFNPLRTLVGRMVLITMMALAISGTISFVLFTSERGASIRLAIEAAMTDEIVSAYARIAAAEPDQRAQLASSMRGFGIAYAMGAAPTVTSSTRTEAARGVSRTLTDRLGQDVEVRVKTNMVQMPSYMWRSSRDFRLRVDGTLSPHATRLERDPIISVNDTKVSIPLDGQWLNARFLSPGPGPPPLSAIVATLIGIIVVGAGAALVARQIARPLRDLAAAARALGAGETDISAPVHGPEDVRHASTAFNAMAQRLGRQLSRQRQMLWALSHDLRTPITALKLRAELVEDEASRQRLLAPLAEMEALTEQALSLARAGASDEQRKTVDVAEIARTLAGEMQEMGVSISAEAPSAVFAECRPSELARAMRNLVENAAKYGGGGVMHVSQGALNEAIVEVIDEGPGVPEPMLTRLTEPFYRADGARSAAGGAGLGLAIAQAIADSHGGRLALHNRAPRGFSAKLIVPG
jgi:signal transduction histidine kinase